MNEITTSINELANGGLEKQLQNTQNLQLSDGQATIALIVSIVIGLIICFFGLKLVRVFAALAGFIVGAAIGFLIAAVLGLNGLAFAGVILVCGIVLAILAGILYRVGIFIWIFLIGFGTALSIIAPSSTLLYVVCLVLGLVTAIVAVILVEPIVIIISALGGGFQVGSAIAVFVGIDSNILITYAIVLVVAVLGMIVQFMGRSREIGKKEKVHATKVKAKSSREAEVEQARMLLDDDSEEDTDSDNDSDDDIHFVE